MYSSIRPWLLVAVVAFPPPGLAIDGDHANALREYLAQDDPAYRWEVRSAGDFDTARYAELRLTSQRWRDTLWRHQLYIIMPSSADAQVDSAMLLISGGSWRQRFESNPDKPRMPREAALYVALAEQLETPLAILRQVPYQPLFDGKKEDAAIAYSFDRYLNGSDWRWPLLLPMVKSAVRAMDAIQAYAREEWDAGIEHFTVSGASKRGWTTWLTAATDPRVHALAPMVFDILGMDRQLRHQKSVWGDVSRKLDDYTRYNLHERLPTPRGQQLQRIVDPLNYRDALTEPKLIILGTNDAYWPLDALNLYWDALEGPKYVLYIPNGGHPIRDYERIVGSVSALHRRVRQGRAMPDLEWTFRRNGKRLVLDVTTDGHVHDVRAWVAHSPVRDLRGAEWRSHKMRRRETGYRYRLRLPREGYAAIFAEVVYRERSGLPFYLTSTVRVAGPAEGGPVDVPTRLR